jgi:hypothetical protein
MSATKPRILGYERPRVEGEKLDSLELKSGMINISTGARQWNQLGPPMVRRVFAPKPPISADFHRTKVAARPTSHCDFFRRGAISLWFRISGHNTSCVNGGRFHPETSREQRRGGSPGKRRPTGGLG